MTQVAFRSLDPFFLDPLRLARNFFDQEAPTKPRETSAQADWVPRFDVVETETAYRFEADVPGVKESDLEVTLDGRTLTIAGSRERTQRAEADNQQIAERMWGRFSRSFRLPATVDADAIEANLREGVLTVTVGKKPEIKPRKVPIGTAKDGKLSAAS